jgi:NAD(P)-dependent dehydrogenase (short-subunit alcohol dehydrogenase family)
VDITGSALVTGASRGIGRAVAIELADRGFDTVATMRHPDAGDGLPGATTGRLTVARMDVNDPDTYSLPDDLRVLVNNAGVDSAYLPVENGRIDDRRAVLETKLFGRVGATQVCNISSSSIFASVPFYSAYRAAKAAVSAFGDTLRVEVAPSGIRVVEVLPGPIDTDMFQLSTGEPAAAGFDRYRPMAERATQLRQETADPMVATPAAAAALIVDAILDDDGPMRYGCDPLSIGLLDLWRQSDDETMFALTGRSILDAVRPSDP